LEIFGGANGHNTLVLGKAFDEAKKRGINLWKAPWDSRFKPIRAFLFFKCWSRIKINECLEQKPILNFTVVQSHRTVFVNLSVRCTIGKVIQIPVLGKLGIFLETKPFPRRLLDSGTSYHLVS
jgi:hypothetical protein